MMGLSGRKGFRICSSISDGRVVNDGALASECGRYGSVEVGGSAMAADLAVRSTRSLACDWILIVGKNVLLTLGALVKVWISEKGKIFMC